MVASMKYFIELAWEPDLKIISAVTSLLQSGFLADF